MEESQILQHISFSYDVNERVNICNDYFLCTICGKFYTQMLN